MTPASEGVWRTFLARFPRCRLYTVDPGAHAIAVEVAPLLRELGRLDGWYAEGWSATRDPTLLAASALAAALEPGDTLVLGSQTGFARTRAVLDAATERGASTVFLFDHWKNYAEHFAGGRLPCVVVLPDEFARQGFRAALGGSPDCECELAILPHPGIDAAVQRVRAFAPPAEPVVALLLDPTEIGDGLGYDWRGTLDAAIAAMRERPGHALRVKQHPRQDSAAVAAAIAARRDAVDASLSMDETERLIAGAREVWGMTTVALNVALAAGKPIRSYQVGRTALGRLASNPHIERWAIT